MYMYLKIKVMTSPVSCCLHYPQIVSLFRLTAFMYNKTICKESIWKVTVLFVAYYFSDLISNMPKAVNDDCSLIANLSKCEWLNWWGP